MYIACKQNMKRIKTTISLDIEIKEKSPFLWFKLSVYAIIKNYISPKEKLMLNSIKQTVTLYMLDQSQVMGLFVLACKFQEVFCSMFEWSYLQRQLAEWAKN